MSTEAPSTEAPTNESSPITRLAYMRLVRGCSQRSLAEKSSINQSELSRIESLRNIAYPRQLARLADALGLPPEEAHTLQSLVDRATGEPVSS